MAGLGSIGIYIYINKYIYIHIYECVFIFRINARYCFFNQTSEDIKRFEVT